MGEPRKRIDLKLPPDLLERIDAAAAMGGLTRTAWIEQVARAALGRDASPVGWQPPVRAARPGSHAGWQGNRRPSQVTPIPKGSSR